MKEQDQIKAIAELDGKHYWTGDEQERDCVICGGKPPADQHCFGDYLKSYDAIIPVIQKHMTDKTMPMTIDDYLPVGVYFHNAKPTQLCEALLKSVGKWKD